MRIKLAYLSISLQNCMHIELMQYSVVSEKADGYILLHTNGWAGVVGMHKRRALATTGVQKFIYKYMYIIYSIKVRWVDSRFKWSQVAGGVGMGQVISNYYCF